MQYRAIKSGNGTSPTLDDEVLVNYLGITLDGTAFEETYSAGKPATVKMNALEPGLQAVLQRMDVGAEWEVYMPAGPSPGSSTEPRHAPESRQKIYLIELLQVIKDYGPGLDRPSR